MIEPLKPTKDEPTIPPKEEGDDSASPDTPPLKQQAEEIMAQVEKDVQDMETDDLTTTRRIDSQARTILNKIFGVINEVDIVAAEERVRRLEDKYPDASPADIVQRLIRYKCQQTGAIGAVTASPDLIPGIGTAAALTLGTAADIGATFKLQAELVLEVAAAHEYPLTEKEKERIVMLITGISTGTSTLARKAGEQMALKASERFAEKSILKALPVIGIIASAGTNVVSTYIIGQRADAYFRLGPEAMQSWSDSLRTLTGVDERNILSWLADSRRATGEAVVSGATVVGEAFSSGVQRASEAGKTVGGVLASGAGKGVQRAAEAGKTVGGVLATGAGKMVAAPQTGFQRMRNLFWTTEEEDDIVEGKVLSRLEINLNEAIYPYTFESVYRTDIWGGRHFETELGRPIPEGRVAECWEIATQPATFIHNGPVAGHRLTELLKLLGLNLVGHRATDMLKRHQFPLTLKLLDVNKPLSLHVDSAAEHEPGQLGQTRLWYILRANPAAQVIYGLAKSVPPTEFVAAIEAGDLRPYLHKLPVQAGDVILIPPGTVYALLEGVVLLEIQRNSEATYRVFDWNRLDSQGEPRPLHLDQAMAVINFEVVQPGPSPRELVAVGNGFRRYQLARCPYFKVEQFDFEARATFRHQGKGKTFEIWGVLNGSGQVQWGGDTVKLSAVQFTLLPAMLGDFAIRATTPGEWLRIYVP